MIPLKYNLRNLRVRWVTTTLTVLGTGLVVWSSCILFGMVDGLLGRRKGGRGGGHEASVKHREQNWTAVRLGC